MEEEEASPNRANAQGRGGGEVAYPVRDLVQNGLALVFALRDESGW